jgi:hypothetical protein
MNSVEKKGGMISAQEREQKELRELSALWRRVKKIRRQKLTIAKLNNG